jgi:polyribonucleotide nucleotidyltransferase
MVIRESIQFNGKEIALETGHLAKQASGAVLASYGDTRVLVTVVVQESKEDIGYFPLRVDYEERFYASGKIPGGFFKREGRPSDVAILSARMIDRPIRPLFPDGYKDEVQIIATVLSAEPDCSPSILGILGASAALSISEAPFAGPIAGVKVGRKDGRLIVNPDAVSQEEGGVEITVAGTKQTVTMVEGKMDELSEEEVVEAIGIAHHAIQELIALQERFIDRVAPVKKEFIPPVDETLSAIKERVRAVVWPELPSIRNCSSKKERAEFMERLRERAVEAVVSEDLSKDESAEMEKRVAELVEDLLKAYMRQSILERRERLDGRRPDELRNITCQVGVLPRAHGSALFTRGETQSLGITTLGAARNDEQIIDQMMKEGRKRFMLHYNFPPYSVGEVRRVGSPSRRSIGHGYLAEGSLRAVLPAEEEFPYVIRVVSEILESNGSSSMATVCSASLAMMDAGVPIKKAVAGIAMGMIEDEVLKRRVILTDIMGAEDHYGDMDFKVVGTRDGVTGFQLDVKVGGVGPETLRQALEQAKQARLMILDKMDEAIAEPRDHLSPYAPMLETITIPQEKIGLVIGPGGKMIRRIIEETGAQIDIEDDGTVKLAATDAEAVAAAKEWIEDLTTELEVGTVMKTKVTRIVDFGAFVELKNGSEGLVHVSNLAPGYVENVHDIVKPGDEITIEVIGEDKMGRPDLRRVVEGWEKEERAPHRGKNGSSKRNGTKRPSKKPERTVKVGDIIEGTVENTTDYGAFVELTPGVTGLIHISALSDDYVRRVEDVVRPGDRVTVEVLNIDDRGRYKLRRVVPESEKKDSQLKEPGVEEEKPRTSRFEEEEEPPTFEDRW